MGEAISHPKIQCLNYEYFKIESGIAKTSVENIKPFKQ